MKHIRLFLHYSILMLCPANLIVAQGLIFSNDTAILISCDKTPPAIDSHWIYNTSDLDIALRWERVQNQVPEESFYLMIFNGTQYLDLTSQGVQYVSAHDSTNIIFEFWHEDIVPGDSVIVRIKVYNEADSLNTSQYQTVIQYCPLQTSNAEPSVEQHPIVYPNPMHDETTVILPASPKPSTLVLYTLTGQIVRQLPVTQNEIMLSRDNLPNGMYFLAMIQDGRVMNMTKLAITD